jgi:hypothetical protein
MTTPVLLMLAWDINAGEEGHLVLAMQLFCSNSDTADIDEIKLLAHASTRSLGERYICTIH